MKEGIIQSFLKIDQGFQGFFRPWKCLLVVFLFSLSCKVDKETKVSNFPPFTFLSIDSIELSGANRLITKVKLSWSGTDRDGFVSGYKVAWDQDKAQCKVKLEAASPVSRTDSTFLFSFTNPNGADTADIWFMVQAIDNKGLLDPNPRTIKIPVRNSPPTIQFLKDGLPDTDTIFSVLSFPYTFSDLDGDDNIDSVLIRINEGSWVALPKNIEFLSLVPENPEANGETFGLVYGGNGLATQNAKPAPLPNVRIPGLVVNGRNRIYLKIKDLAGATHIDSTGRQYHFTRKTADLLIIDAYKGEGAVIGDSMYYNLISNVCPFDRIDFLGNGGRNRPKFWGTTLYLQASLYKKVFWYSDLFTTAVGENPLLLTYAVPAFSQYLRFDGKMMISTIFPDAPSQISDEDPIFSLVPIDSITSFSRDVRLRRDTTILAWQPGFPNLKSTSFLVTGVDLFYPKPGVDTLYFVRKTNVATIYEGPPLPIALRTKNPFSNRSNLIFFGMELTYLSGDRNALQTLFHRVFNEEFNW